MTRPAVSTLPWLLTALALVLLLWGWQWFTRHFARQMVEVHTGYSPAAERNPYLAAGRFLERLGIPVVTQPGRGPLRALPPPTDTLFVRGLGPMNAARQRALQDWLKAGGRLIVEAMAITGPEQTPKATDFLGGLGVLLRRQETPDADDPATTRPGKDIWEPWAAPQPALPPLRVAFDPRYFLEDTQARATETLRSGGLIRALTFPVGDGFVTVLADTGFLTNPLIGEPDHALFLAQLAADPRPPDPGRRLWLLYDTAMPDLASLLWQTAPQAVTATLLLAALTLWALGRRLGPLVADPPQGHRDLLVHLAAAGAFLWQQGRGEAHLRAAQRRCESAWLRRQPALRGLDATARAAWLAARTGLDQVEVAAALYGRPGGAQPLADARTLQRLWLALLGHPADRPRRLDR